MKKFFIFLVPLALIGATGGCLSTTTAPTPSVYADRTVIDEQAGVGAELAYKAARLLAETAVDAGFLKGANAAKVAALDNTAFQALVSMRLAYKAGNATSYVSAVASAHSAVANMLLIIRKAK